MSSWTRRPSPLGEFDRRLTALPPPGLRGAATRAQSYPLLTHCLRGVDYIKVDGCGSNSYYPTGYKAMGAALESVGRDIVYSCSWPAYIGSNESQKPFATFIMDGCNLWRNWRVDRAPQRERRHPSALTDSPIQTSDRMPQSSTQGRHPVRLGLSLLHYRLLGQLGRGAGTLGRAGALARHGHGEWLVRGGGGVCPRQVCALGLQAAGLLQCAPRYARAAASHRQQLHHAR